MEIDKIKEMLEYRFSLTTELPQKRHIIFWYDSKKEFKDLIEMNKVRNEHRKEISEFERREGNLFSSLMMIIRFDLSI